jgi:hypothetical protein
VDSKEIDQNYVGLMASGHTPEEILKAFPTWKVMTSIKH